MVFPSKPSDVVKAGADSISHSVDLLFELIPAPASAETRPRDFYMTINWSDFPATDPRFTALFKAMKRGGSMLDATVAHAHTRYTLRQLARPAAERTIKDPQGLDDFTFAITRRANEMGVDILAGTDFQEAPETQVYPNIHQELELLVTKAGLTPLQAIRAATVNGAAALGKEADLGRVAPGKIADLIVLRADPIADIRNTKAIRYVIKGGKFYQGSGNK
jgi:imidazolonepropionase-like amidohydrolase